MLVGQVGVYNFVVKPITASLPLTATWDNGTQGPTASYSWTMTGTYTVSVVVANTCSEITDTWSVRILSEWPHHRYLPVVGKPFYVPLQFRRVGLPPATQPSRE
jgi:hypothetical protein